MELRELWGGPLGEKPKQKLGRLSERVTNQKRPGQEGEVNTQAKRETTRGESLKQRVEVGLRSFQWTLWSVAVSYRLD